MIGDTSMFPAAAKRAYLNAASVALMPRVAEEAAVAWQTDLASNGTLNFDEAAEDGVFDQVRASFGALIGAGPRDIAVASSATELIASVAWALKPARGRTIVTTDIVFPTTAYPWARVAADTGAELSFVAAENGWVDEDALIAAIDDRTGVVSISLVEYSSGQLYSLSRLAAATRRVGAFLLVDASQSVGVVPLDVAKTPVDALVTTSYKWLCGPFGVGLLYLAPAWQTRLVPGIVGWRTNAEIYDLRADRWVLHPDARRFEFSTMAYGCAVGLIRSIDLLRDVGIDPVYRHGLRLATRLRDGLVANGADVIGPVDRPLAAPIVSARFPGRSPKEVVVALANRGIVTSPRRDAVRFSPHLYNTDSDIERAIAAVATLGQ